MIAAHADEARRCRLRRVGAHLEATFQCVDDLRGIRGDPAGTGNRLRPTCGPGSAPLPVAYALATDGAAPRELAVLYGGSGPLDRDRAARAAALVETAGGRAWATRRARRRVDAALEELRRTAPRPAAAAGLATHIRDRLIGAG